jgi:hypothetical protein
MSSNGHSDLAEEPTAGAYADSTSGDEVPVVQHIHNLLVDAANARTQAIFSNLNTTAPPFSPRPCTLSAEAADIANAFQAMSIHTPARQSPNATTTNTSNLVEEGVYEVSIPQQNVVGYEDCTEMAPGTIATGQTMVGPEEPTAGHNWLSSCGLSAHDNLSPGPQCREPREYCHDHNPPIPIPAPIEPLPI